VWNLHSSKPFLEKCPNMRKHVLDNQYALIIFVFYTLDFLAPKIVDLPQRVYRIMQNNVMSL